MALELPKIRLGPRPRKWDFAAIAVLVLGAACAGASWRAAQAQAPGVSLSGGATGMIVLAQLLVAAASLLLLGKTATEGTLWGNLAAVAGTFTGMGGVLLAAALWAAA